METADPGPTLGPRYAPDDPTLPSPWKGLIDGSTGLFYYWNPETNVTQYEKPASLPPLLPAGPPPPTTTASTPKLAPIPVAQSVSSNGVIAQHESQIKGPTQHEEEPKQQHGHLTNQLGLQLAHAGVQHMGQAMQMMQHPGQQMPQQTIQQIPQHAPNQASQMGQPQGHQFTHNPIQYMPYRPQSMVPNVHQSLQSAPGLPYANQHEYNKMTYPKREEDNFQHGSQIGFSPSQFQPHVTSSGQSIPSGTNTPQVQQFGMHPGQGQQFGGPNSKIQRPLSISQIQQTGTDFSHLTNRQPLPRFQDQMAPAMMHGQQGGVPPVGMKMVNEENWHGRSGNEHHYGANKEGPGITPNQLKPAAIPMARAQQEMRIIGVPLPSVSPGPTSGLNAVGGNLMHNMHTHGTGAHPFPSNTLMGSPHTKPSDVRMSPAEVYRQQHEVTATGEHVPAPYMTFEDTGFPPELLREMYTAGFSTPTPIQAQTWPIALQSRDIVAIAKTGSGKTLGYLIPAFMLLKQRHNNPQNGPTVLVLAPTRELATQIQDEVNKFGRSSKVSCTCLYGGAPKGPQLKELERGADIVVATPGRLNDILEMKMIQFRQISLLVLDEADRMLDMGFEPQIRKIVNEIPPHRQTLMYTATWPKEVRKIAGDLLVNPVQVNIGNVDELAANKSITQYVEVVPQVEKQRRLEQILRAQERGSKVIIFCSTKKLCDYLASMLGRTFGAAAIHGDKSQGERDWVLNQFRSGKSPILVATDVAARGLDIKDIRVVVNYDFPTGIEDYVHRIGRTGRAGATGMSYTFFSDHDWKYAADLVKLLEGANQHVPPEVRDMAMRGGPSFTKDRVGFSRVDSGGGGRWDYGGRGGGSIRDGGCGGSMRNSGFSGRSDFFSGRGGNRGGRDGFGGGWGRNERGSHDNNRFTNMDRRGGRGRGRGRFDNRRGIVPSGDRERGRSYSPSPERVRTWGYSRSRSRSRSSRSWSRSQSRSRSRSRSRSWSQGRRSRSRSFDRPDRPRVRNFDRPDRPRVRNFDKVNPAMVENKAPPIPTVISDAVGPTNEDSETKLTATLPEMEGTEEAGQPLGVDCS